MEKEKIDRRKIGTAYEQEAVLFLKQKGYRIIARNYYCKQGEIDIIAVDQNYLVFVEVKYRSKKKSTSALEAVTLQKQRHIIRSAQCYLYQNGYPEDTSCRFDVIAIQGDTMQHIVNAFESYFM